MSDGTDAWDLDGLKRRVALMRALGVTKWGDIELGPAVSPETDEAVDDALKSADDLEDLLYAASCGVDWRTKPKRAGN